MNTEINNAKTAEILYEEKDNILLIVLNKPNKKNALSLSMYKELTAILKNAEKNDDIKVVLIQGNKECFSSGNDISDFLNTPKLDKTHPIVNFLFTVANFSKPLIAAVAGPAIGIGTTLLLHCDLVYAAPNAKFQLPFVNLGLCPEFGASLLLPLTIGHQKASELLLLGEAFSAEEANKLNIVNSIYSVENLFLESYKVAQKIAKKSGPAIYTTKKLLKQSYNNKINNVINNEILDFARLMESKEAISAFNNFLKI